MIQHSVRGRVVVRGAGEMASGVIRCLVMAGFEVIAIEKPAPTCVRRPVCFAEAFFEQRVTVEGVTAVLVNSTEEATAIMGSRSVPLLIDPEAKQLPALEPTAVVDGRMRKRDVDTDLDIAPIVIGLGPGFVAGENCHAAVETNRGRDLGRVIYAGRPEPYTGTPASVNGFSHERVLRSPADGVFTTHCEITDLVESGQVIGEVDGIPVVGRIDGMVRGMIRTGMDVSFGQKIGDIDPRCRKDLCFKISDKAHAIGNAALQALTELRATVLDH
ncbi:MAG: EF2563 family selenium-dependent molybdenum hydroxylase system protein [candidate division Zixibacteria bacterium]|nr:EF2563 family selenium-dependent molybdenum hydroxylase system protein [candidate division Zixibacteria bacterium]MBU1470075.1 EF2563 family selenium-dependent molybdenum hydroxylase system protein [candidate division Zixibacteria bacterium]MBU2624395.1 EF2563 family selenium-dependent molybdenum hydroxylase system protein [candidate division Zixibacteria bacterium]